MRTLIAAALLASCASPGATRPVADEGVPAVLVDPTPQGRAALLQAVTDLVGTRPLLADDALTRESTLILEPRHMEGRETRAPQKIRLVKLGEDCVLIHDGSGRRAVLVENQCKEAP